MSVHRNKMLELETNMFLKLFYVNSELCVRYLSRLPESVCNALQNCLSICLMHCRESEGIFYYVLFSMLESPCLLYFSE